MPLTRIFCYGDSLTAGTIPGCEPQLFPYGPILEQHLKMKNYGENFAVRWKGLPGWTAASMVENQSVDGVGLHALIQNKGVNLCVLLAGTNDLGAMFSTTCSDDDVANRIAESVISLHEIAHSDGVSTIAIGIPSSGFQEQTPLAKSIRVKANNIIKDWCHHKGGLALYADFPFGWIPGDKRWASDTLHLSEIGYNEIADYLAKIYTKNLL